MSFECKYCCDKNCELLRKECRPGQKGCVLRRAGAFFIGEEKEDTGGEEDKTEGKNEVDS